MGGFRASGLEFRVRCSLPSLSHMQACEECEDSWHCSVEAYLLVVSTAPSAP